MKILEILDSSIEDKHFRGKFGITDMGRKSKRGANHLGTGNYATVKNDKDPHMVVKTSRSPDEADDPYWVFAREVIENNLWENPYFPRLYTLKNIKDSSNAAMNRVKMEKLFPLSSLGDEEAKYILERTIGDTDMEWDPERFAEAINNHSFLDVKLADPQLAAAIKTLEKMRREYKHLNITLDIHDDNIMVRRTPYGPQLVITDPFG